MSYKLYFQELLSLVDVSPTNASDVLDAIAEAKDGTHNTIAALTMFMQFASNLEEGAPTRSAYQDAAWAVQLLNDLAKGLEQLERRVGSPATAA